MHKTDSMEGDAKIRQKLIQLGYTMMPVTASMCDFLDKFISLDPRCLPLLEDMHCESIHNNILTAYNNCHSAVHSTTSGYTPRVISFFLKNKTLAVLCASVS